MVKKITQKNNERLVLQQKTELSQLKESLPIDLLRAAEDKLLHQCLEVVESSLDFASLGFLPSGELDEDSIPVAWNFLSDQEKARKIRLAKYSCLPSADVPHGVKLAHTTLVGILKSRATEKSGTKVFNLEVSTFPAPAPITQEKDAIDAEFEVLDVDG